MGYFDFEGMVEDNDDRECMVCHGSYMQHHYYSNESHPFITTNLEYLEWKYEQKQLQAV